MKPETVSGLKQYMSTEDLQKRTTVNIQEKANLIWTIADKQVGTYKPHEYGNVILPIDDEQQSVASYLDTKCAEIDALIAIKQAKIDELKDYKKSVIYEYVTGKKEVV